MPFTVAFATDNIMFGIIFIIITILICDICNITKISMIMRRISLVLFAMLALTMMAKQSSSSLRLWYQKPAGKWEEALPLGNGRIGAMVFGDALEEHYQLNEETLWSGDPISGNNPNAQMILPYVRQAVDQGDYEKAAGLWKQYAQGPYSARYLPMGDLFITMKGEKGKVSGYKRELDLERAVSTVRYKAGTAAVVRETFASYPDHLMIVHMKTDKSGSLSFEAGMKSDLRYKVTEGPDGQLILTGKAPSYVASRDYEPMQVAYSANLGMDFEIRLQVLEKEVRKYVKDDKLLVEGAKEVTLLLSCATDYINPLVKPDVTKRNLSQVAQQYLNMSSRKTYTQLYSAHLKDYQELFSRVDIHLGSKKYYRKDLPTDSRLKAFASSNSDEGIVELYFQYGRYLTIASSRKGGLPSNLQGIWNHHVQPSWGSNFTVNINTEMNYWPVEVTNLSECFLPLSDFIGYMAKNGQETALVNYGMKDSWVAHHNSDGWAKTSPTGGYAWDAKGSPRWSCWPMAGVWLCQHL